MSFGWSVAEMPASEMVLSVPLGSVVEASSAFVDASSTFTVPEAVPPPPGENVVAPTVSSAHVVTP